MVQQWLSIGEPVAAPPKTTATSAPPATTVSPSAVSIQVVNGSGVSGQATLAAADLRTLGYTPTISGLGDFGHAGNVINYAPDSLAAARQLASQLVNGATLTQDTALGLHRLQPAAPDRSELRRRQGRHRGHDDHDVDDRPRPLLRHQHRRPGERHDRRRRAGVVVVLQGSVHPAGPGAGPDPADLPQLIAERRA